MEAFFVSKKINIILFSAIVVLLFAPFFEYSQSSDSFVYVNAFGLMPGLSSIMSMNEHYSTIYELMGGFYSFLFLAFPILCLVISLMREFLKNDKMAFRLYILSFVISFVAFIFTIASLQEVESYELSFGYFGTIFVYLLVFAAGIFDYLITVSPKEEDIWGPVLGRNKNIRKKIR